MRAGLFVGVDIGAHHGEPGLVEIGNKRRLAVVEFMIAQCRRIRLYLVEELRFGLTLVGGVEERSLKIVARVEQNDILALKPAALPVDGGDQARGATEAFAFLLLIGRARRFISVVRLDAAVPVVEVENVERVVGKGRSRAKGQGGS